MASKLPSRFLASARHHGLRPTRCRTLARLYSSEAATPSLLTNMKLDLKLAMKAKDKARLDVLRSVISAVNNASKTPSPIKTDGQIVALLKKTTRLSQDAAEEFRAAGRADLVEKEEAQIKIIDNYVRGSGVEMLDEEGVRAAIVATISEIRAEGLKVNVGEVSKRLFPAGAKLHGKDFDTKRAVEMVKEESAK